MSRQGSPKKRYNCLINEKPKHNDTFLDEFTKKAETLKTVEDLIREKSSSSPAQNKQSLKRFKQLQEYLKMAHREVKINQNIRNETKRIVKGEIPLGTDTQIKHELRESYPSILEIKRRLKGCLSIN